MKGFKVKLSQSLQTSLKVARVKENNIIFT